MVAEPSGSIRNPVHLERFKGENFRGWMTRFKSMMFIIDAQYEDLFEHFENTNKFNRTIVDDDFNNRDGTRHESSFKLSKILKSYVVNYCDYSLDVVLNAESTSQRLRAMATIARAIRSSLKGYGNESIGTSDEHEVRFKLPRERPGEF